MNNLLNIPPGFCRCGCGQRTNIVKQDDPDRGYKKGDYRRFVNHHHIKNMQPGYQSNVQPKTCVICGKKFLPRKPSRQNTQVTCSAKCRNTYNSKNSVQKRANSLRGRGEGKTYRKYRGVHEHRFVMERILGRNLTSEEIVHHKDENMFNNNPDNLEIVTRSEHAKIHLHNYARSENGNEFLREPAASY